MDKKSDPRNVALGQRIRRWRERRGHKLNAFAQMLGVPENTYRSWELGTRGMRAIDLPPIALALDVDVDALLGTRSEQLSLPKTRPEPVYLVMRDAISRIERATDIRELRDLFLFGIQSGIEIPTNAEEVTTEEWGRIEQAMAAKIAALGGIPRSW